MQRFRRMRSLQKFAAVHASDCNHFNLDRSLSSRAIFKTNHAAALAERRGLLAAWEEPPFREVETVSKLSDTTKELS